MNAVNQVMASRDDLTERLISALREEILPSSGEDLSLSDIDRALEELSSQFDKLLREAAISVDGSENSEQFRRISTAMAELKERRTQVEKIHIPSSPWAGPRAMMWRMASWTQRHQTLKHNS